MRLFREVSSASAAAESLSLGRQEKVTKEKATRSSRPAAPGLRRAGGVSRRHVPVPTRNSRASCARPCGLILRSAAAIYGEVDQEPGSRARGLLLLAPPSRRWCRAAQSGSGERRACLSAWMREFAPARVRRAAQGTARSAAPASGALLFGSFLLGTQEKGTRPPPRAGSPGGREDGTGSGLRRTKPRDKSTSSEKSLELDASSAAGRPVLSLSKGWHDEQANHEQEIHEQAIHEQAIHEQASNPRQGLPPPRQARPPLTPPADASARTAPTRHRNSRRWPSCRSCGLRP